LAAFPDLHHELAGVRELQNHVVGAAAGRWLGPSAVTADPDESLGVDRDAVLALGPVEPGSVAAPAAEQLTCRVELEDGRRRVGALFRRDGSWPVQHPDVV